MWATWDRAPLITPDLEERLYDVMQHHASRMGARVIAIGGVEDHVHMLVRIPATLAVADLVGRIKGGSSHFAAQVLGRDFKWQGGYAAYSISPSAVPHVRDYVLAQKQRHADRASSPDAVEAPNRTRQRPVSGLPAV
ncbi:transposase [Longimicrobium terrae]|uniref:transposase n=1 Tax=Longimicrobium terrae TaxID=1639882 RepID=UPI0030B80F62